ncbi:MAG: IgGFc-binding protein [Myxococcales bacterium]|nr:IgGFc-binding protein [Myxococcales bacterium]
MTRRFATPVALSMACLAVVAVAGACASDRDAFVKEPELIPPTPSTPEADAGDCRLQCSLDGRSVIQSCTGAVVEKCADTLACGAAQCQEPCAAAAADSSSNGCEFYVQNFAYNEDGCLAAFIVNTSAQPVTIGLDKSGEALDLSKAVWRTNPGDAKLFEHSGPIPPGESVVLFIASPNPEAKALYGDGAVACPEGVVAATKGSTLYRSGIASSLHLTASAPVSAVAMYPFGGAPSHKPATTLLMPVVTWAKEHVLIDGWEFNVGVPATQIVAAQDGTEITLIPTKSVQDGAKIKGGPPKVPLTYSLDKGEYLQLSQPDQLAGSLVLSSKPTSVFGGHTCAFIPSNNGACDMLWQQIPSFDQWGSEYVGVGYRQRTESPNEFMPYRIVAAQDGTRLDYDPYIPPGAPTEMNAGDNVTFPVRVNETFVVRTQDPEHPIYVAAYMTGRTGGYFGTPDMAGSGDPEFVNVVPAGQWLNSYSFYADPSYEETSLVVVRAKERDKFEDVWLECAGILEGWTPIGTRGDYEFVRVDLQRKGGPGQSFGDKACRTGLHRMKSDGPFTATIWGWAFAASYAYPGGMALRKLVDTPLLPIK